MSANSGRLRKGLKVIHEGKEKIVKDWFWTSDTVSNNGTPVRTRYHRVWDEKVRAISGGLTITPPVKGQWVHGNTLFKERMIPVRIACTKEEIEKIADMTAVYYSQIAIMYYVIGTDVTIKHYN